MGVFHKMTSADKWLAHTRRAGRAVQVSTDCRFQPRMLSGAWVKELTVIGVCVVQKFVASPIAASRICFVSCSALAQANSLGWQV